MVGLERNFRYIFVYLILCFHPLYHPSQKKNQLGKSKWQRGLRHLVGPYLDISKLRRTYLYLPCCLLFHSLYPFFLGLWWVPSISGILVRFPWLSITGFHIVPLAIAGARGGHVLHGTIHVIETLHHRWPEMHTCRFNENLFHTNCFFEVPTFFKLGDPEWLYIYNIYLNYK